VSAGIVAFLSAVFCSAAAFSLASLTSPFSVHALEQVGNNDVFGELRKVSEEKGTPHEVLHDEITVTYGIEGVWRDSIKAKILGEKLAIDAKAFPARAPEPSGHWFEQGIISLSRSVLRIMGERC
jgi:hypothetical protein